MNTKSQWQAAYDHQAPPEHLAGGIRQFNGYRHPRLYALLQASLKRASRHWRNWQILDAGCGTGDTNSFLKDQNQVVGVDFSQQMLRYARQQYQQVGLADVEHMPFCDGAFQGVIATGVWQCLPAQTPFLKEIQRILRPNGELILGWMLNADYVLYRRGVHSKLAADLSLNPMTSQQMIQALRAAGLEPLALYATVFPLGTLNILDQPFGAAIRPLAPGITVHARRIG